MYVEGQETGNEQKRKNMDNEANLPSNVKCYYILLLDNK